METGQETAATGADTALAARLSYGLLLLGAAALVLELALPAGESVLGPALAAAGVCGAAIFGVRTYGPDRPATWLLVAVAFVVLLAGWGLTSVPYLADHRELYLLPMALVVVGATLLTISTMTIARHRLPRWERGSVLEVVMVAASAAVPTTALLVMPDISARDLPMFMNATIDLLPLVVISLAVVLFRVALWTEQRPPACSFLFLSLVSAAAASVLLAVASPAHVRLSTCLLIIGVTFLGLATLHPTMTMLTRTASTRSRIDGTLFAVVALAIPTATVSAQWLSSGQFDFSSFVGAQVVITALVVWRLHDSFTGLRAARLAAETSEDYFHTVLDNVADLIVTLDEAGDATYVSPSSHEILGLAPGDLAGGQVLHSVHPDDRGMASALLEQAFSAGAVRVNGELRLVAKDGTVRVVSGSAMTLPGGHDGAAVVVALHDVTEHHRLEGELAHMALHDEMTGLPNRALISDRCEQLLARSGRSGATPAALLLDLDDFKDVNDTLGHSAGNALLIAVARRLEAVVPSSDTVGRLGADEFVVLSEQASRDVSAQTVADLVMAAMGEPFDLGDGGPPVSMTASMGIAEGVRASADDLLRDADVALNRAKALGKARCVAFEPEMFSSMKHRLELEIDLREALERRQFFLVYQPIVRLSSLAVTGVEALLRWQHPVRGVVPPVEFIPLLEEQGRIVEVGSFVLREACRQAVAWQRRGLGLSMSVNVSARQLETDELVGTVRRTLADSGLPPELLTLEITETTLMQDAEQTAVVLEQLRGLGVRLAVDDFGVGYSSLGYLRRFPVNVLKIDRSFVTPLAESEDTRTLVRTLVHLGEELGLLTVAEGIETTDQLSVLRAQNCVAGQGYLFSKPLTPSAMEDWLGLPPASPAEPSPNGGRVADGSGHPEGTRRRRDASVAIST